MEKKEGSFYFYFIITLPWNRFEQDLQCLPVYLSAVQDQSGQALAQGLGGCGHEGAWAQWVVAEVE